MKYFSVSSSEGGPPASGELWALVPAAGLGSRMAAQQPKQYLPLLGEPLMLHTLRRLATHPRVVGMVVVVNADDQQFRLLDLTDINSQLSHPLISVPGGASRSESVARGLAKITEQLALLNPLEPETTAPWVMVHDAARPCVRHDDIDRLIDTVDDQGGLLSLEVTDTLWQQDSQQRCQQTLPRDQLRRALTPQLFPLATLARALAACHGEDFHPTDEAEAMSRAGFRPRLVVGAADNIKVTRTGDMELAELFIQRQADSVALITPGIAQDCALQGGC